ncbi:MAG TPA: hypothetical protein VJ794_03030, partial [Gemmatimonadales bacterium]|nr:hypothetical protein [Gemmatimonadales bacterium]
MSDRDHAPRWWAAVARIGLLFLLLGLSPAASASPTAGAARREAPRRPADAAPLAAIDDELLAGVREILGGRGPGHP